MNKKMIILIVSVMVLQSVFAHEDSNANQLTRVEGVIYKNLIQMHENNHISTISAGRIDEYCAVLNKRRQFLSLIIQKYLHRLKSGKFRMYMGFCIVSFLSVLNGSFIKMCVSRLDEIAGFLPGIDQVFGHAINHVSSGNTINGVSMSQAQAQVLLNGFMQVGQGINTIGADLASYITYSRNSLDASANILLVVGALGCVVSAYKLTKHDQSFTSALAEIKKIDEILIKLNQVKAT